MKNKKLILKNNLPFVIAEIGHNHQGSVKKAKLLIEAAKDCGASAVKLQKRDNKNLFTEELYNQIYDNKNSFGKTYGEHREYLELGRKEYLELKKYADKLKIFFFATPFDFNSVDFLDEINVAAYKIASADLKNIPLQKYIAKKKKQIFLSTGGGSMEDINRAYKNIISINKKLSILQCTAAYPVSPKEMNLKVISKLREKYPKLIIGISDHESGIDASAIAYMMGARVFEKHFTLDHSWKGTDHSFSLMPEGLRKLVRNLNRIPEMLGNGVKKTYLSEIKPIKKMAKSIVASKHIKKGKKINLSDLSFKSPGGGLAPYEYKKLINKTLKRELLKDQPISFKDIK